MTFTILNMKKLLYPKRTFFFKIKIHEALIHRRWLGNYDISGHFLPFLQ